MIRLNQKIFISYIVISILFIVFDAVMFSEKNNYKEIIRNDLLLLIPIVIIGLIGYKKNFIGVKFDILLGIISSVFCGLFILLLYHQMCLINVEKYLFLPIIIIILLLITGGIFGHFNIGNDIYREVGVGAALGIVVLAHIYTKYKKENFYTMVLCICAILGCFMFAVAYHFGSKI